MGGCWGVDRVCLLDYGGLRGAISFLCGEMGCYFTFFCDVFFGCLAGFGAFCLNFCFGLGYRELPCGVFR